MAAPPWPADAAPSVITVAGEGLNYLEWVVPTGVFVRLEAVFAEIWSLDAGAEPLLVIVDQSGVVIARKRTTERIEPDVNGSATWALGLADERAVAEVAQPSARVTRPTLENVAAGGSIQISFTSVEWATAGMVDLATFPTRVTIVAAGLYLLRASVQWGAVNETSTYRFANLRLNGANLVDTLVSAVTLNVGNASVAHVLSRVAQLAVDDFVELHVSSFASAGRTVEGGLEVVRIGDTP